MAAKVVLITGANTGIGFQIVRALCNSDQSYTIILGGRSLPKVVDAIANLGVEFPSTSSKLHPLQIDIESDDSIARAIDEVESSFARVDVLVNNAGANFDFPQPEPSLTARELWARTWDVNVTGTHILTHAVAPLLLRSADPRLLFLASGTAALATHGRPDVALNHAPGPGWPKTGGKNDDVSAYRSAKAGLNMVMREWYRLFQADGVKVWAISPGFLATGLAVGRPEVLRQMGAGDPEVAGPFVRSVIEGQRDADVGRVITSHGVQEW